MRIMKSTPMKALVLLVIFTVICGIIYPLAMTGISQLLFKDQANGSIITVDGKQYGSALLAQQFTDEKYLWGRPMNLNTETFSDKEGKPLLYAGPTNITPAGEPLKKSIEERTEKLQKSHPDQRQKPVPADLVTCSGSGLDPHISIEAAKYQAGRIAENRHISKKQVEKVIKKYTTRRTLGIFGEPVVNVLKVNLALDGILK